MKRDMKLASLLIKQIRSSSKISRSRFVFVDTTGAFVPIISIVLSQETLRLFPRAYHLENATHVERWSRVTGQNGGLAKVDSGFD